MKKTLNEILVLVELFDRGRRTGMSTSGFSCDSEAQAVRDTKEALKIFYKKRSKK